MQQCYIARNVECWFPNIQTHVLQHVRFITAAFLLNLGYS